MACSSTNYATNWAALPKNQKIVVLTRDSSKFRFDNWSVGVDSTFIGFENSEARFVHKDSIEFIHIDPGAKPITNYVLPVAVGIAGTMFLIGAAVLLNVRF